MSTTRDRGNQALLHALLTELHGVTRGVTAEKFEGALALFRRQMSGVPAAQLSAAFDTWLDQQGETELWALPTPPQIWAIIRRNTDARAAAAAERQRGFSPGGARPRPEYMTQLAAVMRDAGLDTNTLAQSVDGDGSGMRHIHVDVHPEVDDAGRLQHGRWVIPADPDADPEWKPCPKCTRADYRRARIAAALENLPTPVGSLPCECAGGMVPSKANPARLVYCQNCHPDEWALQTGAAS